MTLTLIFRPIFLLFFSCLAYSNFLYAQKDASTALLDSLQHYSYSKLETKFNIAQSDFVKIGLAKVYLTKAKEGRDIEKIADGFYLMSESYSHSTQAVQYADSIIQITRYFENNKYPALGYMQKGIQLYYLTEYQKALDNYLKANEYYEKYNNRYQQLRVNHYIGLLKNVLGEEEEALDVFRQNMSFFNKKENQISYPKQYLRSMFALTDSYNRNGKLDSAEILGRKGIYKSFHTESGYLYPFFLLSYGATKTLKKEYNEALDSLIKGSTFLKDKKKELARSYIIISEIYINIEQKKSALYYLKKVDSLYQRHPQVVFDARDAYELLLKYYSKEELDVEKQLEVVNRLIKVDSIVNNEYKNLSRQMAKKYEVTELISKKELLIRELEQKKIKSTTVIAILLLALIIFILVTIYYVKKNIIYKRRFATLIENIENKNSDNAGLDAIEPDGKNETSIDSIGLPKKMIDEIIEKLEAFEKSEKYIKNSYTLNSLAKELNTNRTYLSKIINAVKNDNFSKYLNDLKIDYAINKLSTDERYQSYTIQTIAEEMGFNNAQSFSNAFHRKTGIYPSYFMREVEKSKKALLVKEG